METISINYPGFTAESNVQIIKLPTCKGIVIIPANQIIRIQSISNYSKLFLANGKSLVVAKVLHWFEEQAGLFSFIRIHRSHFVNLHYIKSYCGSKSSLLYLLNGEIFSVARRKKASLTTRLKCLNRSITDELANNSRFNIKKTLAA